MNWISTIEPAPWSISGFNLGPLLFGHCTLIERWGLEEINTHEDLQILLGICSRDYKGAWQWLSSKSSHLLEFKNFEECKREFLCYLAENMALPQTFKNQSEGQTVGTPFLQGLRITAITKLNYNPQTLCEARFGQLMWDLLSYKESTGQTRIIDEHLQQQLDRLKELNAEI